MAYALAAVQRTNYQDWYLTSFLLCVGLTAVRVPKPVPVEVGVPEEIVLPLPVPDPAQHEVRQHQCREAQQVAGGGERGLVRQHTQHQADDQFVWRPPQRPPRASGANHTIRA